MKDLKLRAMRSWIEKCHVNLIHFYFNEEQLSVTEELLWSKDFTYFFPIIISQGKYWQSHFRQEEFGLKLRDSKV